MNTWRRKKERKKKEPFTYTQYISAEKDSEFFDSANAARLFADEHAVSIRRPVVHPSDALGAESYEIRMLCALPGEKKYKTVSVEIYTTRIVLRR